MALNQAKTTTTKKNPKTNMGVICPGPIGFQVDFKAIEILTVLTRIFCLCISTISDSCLIEYFSVQFIYFFLQ